jgi:hypothetical protein
MRDERCGLVSLAVLIADCPGRDSGIGRLVLEAARAAGGRTTHFPGLWWTVDGLSPAQAAELERKVEELCRAGR